MLLADHVAVVSCLQEVLRTWFVATRFPARHILQVFVENLHTLEARIGGSLHFVVKVVKPSSSK
jgi:hypothetical protein